MTRELLPQVSREKRTGPISGGGAATAAGYSRKGARYSIWTTEKSIPIKGKRGRSKNRYGHYAAVHNTDPKFGLYTVNQHSSRRPVHRQFIGFSPKIKDYIADNFMDMIFKGFPGV